MPQRVYQGPHADGCWVRIPGEPDIDFPDRETPVEVTADQAAALDRTGEYVTPAKANPAKPKAQKADPDPSLED
jgi:hypothetical protein